MLPLYHCLLFEFSTLDASYVLSRDATLSRPSISHVIARKSVVELERRNECRSKEKEKPCTSPRSIDNINKLYLEVDLTLKGRREREREKIVAREFLRGSRARRAVARYISREDRRRRSMDVGATRFNRDFPIRGEDAPRWGIFPHYGYFTSKSPELIKMGRGLYTTSTLGVWRRDSPAGGRNGQRTKRREKLDDDIRVSLANDDPPMIYACSCTDCLTNPVIANERLRLRPRLRLL